MSRRLGAAAALFLAALIGTTSCSGGQPPPPAPTTAAPAESSASPSPATTSATASAAPAYKPADAAGRAQNVPVPVLPEAAKAETKEGLEAFAKYWFEVLSYGYETGDVSRLDAITSSDCQLCSNVAKSISTNYQPDRWLVGGKIATPSITGNAGPDANANYQVVVQVRQSAIAYYKSDGSEFRAATPPSDTGNVMLAVFKDAAWRVAGLHPIR
ncbi:DUF6318 family protein [Arthrobacter sp. 1P04PC]|uniref:DUF6318 family protein n=1 Tax=unclassified Arthrobacter TaxID=235627 RepID=UPI0039A0A574